MTDSTIETYTQAHMTCMFMLVEEVTDWRHRKEAGSYLPPGKLAFVEGYEAYRAGHGSAELRDRMCDLVATIEAAYDGMTFEEHQHVEDIWGCYDFEYIPWVLSSIGTMWEDTNWFDASPADVWVEKEWLQSITRARLQMEYQPTQYAFDAGMTAAAALNLRHSVDNAMLKTLGEGSGLLKEWKKT